MYKAIYMNRRWMILNIQTWQLINEHYIPSKRQAIKEARWFNLKNSLKISCNYEWFRYNVVIKDKIKKD